MAKVHLYLCMESSKWHILLPKFRKVRMFNKNAMLFNENNLGRWGICSTFALGKSLLRVLLSDFAGRTAPSQHKLLRL